jgi:hypothetical protein
MPETAIRMLMNGPAAGDRQLLAGGGNYLPVDCRADRMTGK